MTDATVVLWGREIGAVSWLDDREIGVFQYAPEFVDSGIQIAPIKMPLGHEPYEFPSLPREAFKGLPGLLADSLPDKYGHALIDAWLASRGRRPESFNPVERLCYIGSRGMGALEFEPAIREGGGHSVAIEVAALVDLANRVLDERMQLHGTLGDDPNTESLEQILRVGTSAGGARAKAVLAYNEKTGEFRSGQIPANSDFGYWLIKFDGVSGNKDKELADPLGFGLIEYAYHQIAQKAGVDMSDCRLHRENNRAHFMTQRFDRVANGEKRHLQSFGALMHFDFNQPDAYSYEQALQMIRQVGMPTSDVEQQFRRAVFNVLARNHDDHVKNIAFLMDKAGQWRLSPAFDVTYAYNPSGAWTSRHQMSVNGKRDQIELNDLLALAKTGSIKAAKAKRIIARVQDAVAQWPVIANQAGVDKQTTEKISKTHRVFL